jgi:MFS family permease
VTAPATLVTVLCVALILIMFGFMPVAAVLPSIFAEWGITETEAGWLSGIYFGGYALGVPVLLPLTDRIDTRKVLLGGIALCAISGFGFAWLADGLWSGILLRIIGGIGLAGFHFPGLKFLSDRLEGTARRRGSAIYVSMFSFGGAVSFLGAGAFESLFGWKAVFAISGWGALVAFFLVLFLIPRAKVQPVAAAGAFLDLPAVMRNHEARRYIAAYFGHVWEVFAMRGWSVALLAYSAAQPGNGYFAGWNMAMVSGAISLLMMPTSFGMAELSARFGRVRVITAATFVTSGLAILLALFNAGPFILVLILVAAYFMAGFGDTATLAAGIVSAADPRVRGATLAVYALVGFVGGMAGPVAFGIVLDAAGGRNDPAAWGWAFASLILAALLTAGALHLKKRR